MSFSISANCESTRDSMASIVEESRVK
jgi:hypothetical protein